MNRRDFCKYAGSGIAALFVASIVPSWISRSPLLASTQQVSELDFTITDAVKNRKGPFPKILVEFWVRSLFHIGSPEPRDRLAIKQRVIGLNY